MTIKVQKLIDIEVAEYYVQKLNDILHYIDNSNLKTRVACSQVRNLVEDALFEYDLECSDE